MKAELRATLAVLYVDDDEGNRVVFEQTFSPQFNVRIAASGSEALEVLARGGIAVLVADQRMPAMSGNELLRRVKDDHPEVVRMVLTAYSDLDPILRAVNDGLVARYVVKPWTPEEVERLLAWGLDAYQMGTQDSEVQLRLLELERLATLGSIYGAMVHDLSEPLSYITTNTERLGILAASLPALRRAVELARAHLPRQDVGNLLALVEELPGICDDLGQGCTMVAEMIHNVRRLLQAKAVEVQQLSHPESVLRFASAVCRRGMMANGIELESDWRTPLAPITIGATELTQVLINLLLNAGQALERVKRADAKVQIAVIEEPACLSFKIRDNGPGMSPDVLRKVGTPFFSTRPGGTGLGMSQVRRIVERVRGTVQVESQEGLGTTVTVRIPKVAPETSASDAAATGAE